MKCVLISKVVLLYKTGERAFPHPKMAKIDSDSIIIDFNRAWAIMVLYKHVTKAIRHASKNASSGEKSKPEGVACSCFLLKAFLIL